MLGSTMDRLTAISSSTRINSISEKPRSLLPTGNITAIILTARDAVGTIGNDVVGTMVTRALVDVGLAPGIERYFFLEIGSIPTLHSARLLVQGLEPFLSSRITPDIET